MFASRQLGPLAERLDRRLVVPTSLLDASSVGQFTGWNLNQPD